MINGSPYERDKDDVRLRAGRPPRAREAGCALAYVNMVGGQDELVFDGDSLVVDADGERARPRPAVRRGAARRRPRPARPRRPRPHRAEVAGVARSRPAEPRTPREPAPEPPRRSTTRPRCTRALVARAARLRAQERLPLGASSACPAASTPRWSRRSPPTRSARRTSYGVSMPSDYSSRALPGRRRRPGRAAPALHYRIVPIAPMVDAFLDALELTGLAEENLQARVRGTIADGRCPTRRATWSWPPATRASSSVGYSTIYGDAVGGFAPIKDVPKTLVWAAGPVAQRRGRRAAAQTPPIPPNSHHKPPSAELRPGQIDTDSLPAVRRARRRSSTTTSSGDRGAARAASPPGFDRGARRAGRCGMVDRAEYKRRQYPPGHRRSPRCAFGRDRRLPITNRWRELGRLSDADVRGPAPGVCPSRIGYTALAKWRTTCDHSCRPGTPFVSLEMGEIDMSMSAASGAPQSTVPHPVRRCADGTPGHHARSDRGEGARREVGHAHRLRPVRPRAIFDEAGIPVLLVGDSAANNVLRLRRPPCRSPSTSCCRWSAAVVRGARARAGRRPTCRSAPTRPAPSRRWTPPTRFMKEGRRPRRQARGRRAGRRRRSRRWSAAGIPVMAHLGFTPQSEHALGGYRVQGRGEAGETPGRRRRWPWRRPARSPIVLEMVPGDAGRAR